MAVFRIEKTRDYTVMSNHHLRDMSLSLKAKGLLSLMLSLPENWDYTMKGLSRICKDGIDSISGGIRELEEHGYLIRERVRGANGQLGSIEYTILEKPKEPTPAQEKPIRENPVQANPTLVTPVQEEPAQLNKDRSSNDPSRTDLSSTEISNPNMKQIYKKLLAAALGVSMLLSMVGCGQNDTSDQTQTGGENEAKVLTIVTAKELDSLTTLTMNKENNIACGLVYETLVAYEDGEIVPELAEEWGWDETNTVLTFKLRQDVAFTDGAAFNAESVKEILDFDRSNPNFSGIKGIYNIESVEVVDEYTVAVHYAAPCFSYINDFCFQNVAGMMSPNVFEAENFQTFTDVVGTGPYIREEMISGDCTRFVRNENYWGEAPYYDEVVIKYIPEASSRLQALQTGEVDLIYGADLLSYDDYNQALSLDGIEGAINDGNTLTRNLVLNASSEILSDLKVRQAIAYAVNKEEITKGLTYGYETPATSLFAPGAPYTDITYNSTWSYDLDKANALLDEAGWVMNESTGIREKDGQQLSLNYTYWTDLSLAQDMALAIKTQLAEVGIDVTTTGQDQMTWWTEGVAGNYDITTWNTEGSYTEPHKFLQESLGADPHAISLQALEDFQSYSDAVNAFSTSADPEVVQSAIATALNVSNDNVIDLPISYSKDLVVYNSSKIAGYTFSSVPQFFEIDNVQPAE